MTRRRHNRAVDRLSEAAYWAVRLDSKDSGPADRAAFEAWRNAEDDNANAYDRVQRGLASVDRHSASPELTALGHQALAETATARWRWSAAAAVLLAVGAAILAIIPRDEADRRDPGAEAPAGPLVFDTAVGERSTVALSDESIVTLNTNSLLHAHFARDSNVRRVILVRGQAHFDVEPDPRPFEVIAENRRIVALGTAFDVRIDPTFGVQVTLLEGRVSVDEIESSTNADLAPERSSRRTELQPGEQFRSGSAAPAKVTPGDMERATSWREGRLVFRNDTLASAVQEINRYSFDKLYIDEHAELHDVRISGVFSTGSTRTFVKAVQTVHPIEARSVGPGHMELSWRDPDAGTDTAIEGS